MDDLHDLLRAGDRLDDLLADRALAHRRDELPHDLQVHIGLEQRDAHVAERFLEVGLGDARPPAQALESERELVGELLEHRPL